MEHLEAERRLRELARQAVAGDLDQLAGEVMALRRELRAVRDAAGLPAPGVSRDDRQVAVAVLRARGCSTRAIADVLGLGRTTVQADLRALGVERPPLIRGLDGRLTRGPVA